MRKPTLYLMCGLPGSGKTTAAKRIEREAPALRLTPDEWMVPLYGLAICRPPSLAVWNEAHDRVERVQWEIAESAMKMGANVVLDFGVWARSEREEFRRRAEEVGARSELIFLDEPLDELKRRVRARNAVLGETAYAISDTELEEWFLRFEPPTQAELRAWE